MRWTVLVLLATNVGLFIWFYSQSNTRLAADSPVAQSQASVSSGVEGGAEIASIDLVREVDPSSLLQAVPAQKPGAMEGGIDGAQLCTLVGPFDEAYQGEYVAQRLQALQIDAALREIEMHGQMRYWVYLSPLDSRREAYRKLRELQAAGVDSYVIPKGSLANGISFGIFSERERAGLLVQELEAQGVSVESREEPQTYMEMWVVLPAGSGEKLADDFWQQLQLDYPQVGRRQNLCSEIKDVQPDDS